MKKLSEQMYLELGIAAKFAGKVIAFTPVMREGMVGLGIAVANEPGYVPVPLFFCNADRYDEMATFAEELNEKKLGLDIRAAARVVGSSMSAGPVKR